MVFRINKPQPTDTFSESQPYLEQNFTAIKTAFDVNHEALTGLGGDEGKHKFVELRSLVSTGSDVPSTAADEGAVYCKPGSVNGNLDIFFRRESNGAEINMNESTRNVNGMQRLSSGQLLKWGTFTVAPNIGNGEQDFNVNPVFTSIYQVLLTVSRNPNSSINDVNAWAYTDTITVNGFTWYLRRRNLEAQSGTDRGNSLLYWLAIGE
ncbi:MAG: hypothetical protein R3230_01440 [Nitrosopumilaceae archaeon]|nr:hypothetical protein [Nitrosopumilaceae archaeon]